MWKRPAPLSPVRGAFALLLLLPSSGLAHDLWILPGKYRLDVGEITRVFVNNGDVYPESLTLLGEHRLSGVSSTSPAGHLAIEGFRVDGKSLTFDFQSEVPGSHVIALETKPRMVRMKGEDFESYLAEEGLTEMAERRKELGQSSEPAVERYAKWAKAVVDVGEEEGAARLWAESVGQPFEIVPLVNPNRVRPGESFRFRVLLDGEPLARARVTGARVSGPSREIASSTDERGECSIAVTAPGRWFVRALHMVYLEGDPEVSWQSYWATLSFEVQPARGNSP